MDKQKTVAQQQLAAQMGMWAEAGLWIARQWLLSLQFSAKWPFLQE